MLSQQEESIQLSIGGTVNKIQRLEQYLTELEVYLTKSKSEAIGSALGTLRFHELVLLYVGAQRYPIVIERLKDEFGVDVTDRALQGAFDINEQSWRDNPRGICVPNNKSIQSSIKILNSFSSR